MVDSCVLLSKRICRGGSLTESCTDSVGVLGQEVSATCAALWTSHVGTGGVRIGASRYVAQLLHAVNFGNSYSFAYSLMDRRPGSYRAVPFRSLYLYRAARARDSPTEARPLAARLCPDSPLSASPCEFNLILATYGRVAPPGIAIRLTHTL